jgi:hypothetical protein
MMSDIDETVKRLRTAGFDAMRVNVVHSDQMTDSKQVLKDVVEWLRKQASTARAWPTVLALKKAADAIERGDWKAGDDER